MLLQRSQSFHSEPLRSLRHSSDEGSRACATIREAARRAQHSLARRLQITAERELLGSRPGISSAARDAKSGEESEKCWIGRSAAEWRPKEEVEAGAAWRAESLGARNRGPHTSTLPLQRLRRLQWLESCRIVEADELSEGCLSDCSLPEDFASGPAARKMAVPASQQAQSSCRNRSAKIAAKTLVPVMHAVEAQHKTGAGLAPARATRARCCHGLRTCKAARVCTARCIGGSQQLKQQRRSPRPRVIGLSALRG